MSTTISRNFKRKRGVPAHPRRGNGPPPRVISSPQLSVYDGTDRLGSFRRNNDDFIAFSRLGHVIGSFRSQREAVDAIQREAVS
jgi:hypothetical protein